jgi:hypothetical protein
MSNLLAGTRIRVQNGGSAFQLDAAGNRTTIGPFSTLNGGCEAGPISPPGLPGAPSPSPPPPSPTTTQPAASTSTTRPPPGPTTTQPPPTSTTTNASTTTTRPPPIPSAPVRITSPASGSTVNGVALVTVTADGLSNVRRVDLYVDGVREQADYRGPFLFAWAAFTLPPCSHTLQATLVRTDGTTIRSSPVAVETTGR